MLALLPMVLLASCRWCVNPVLSVPTLRPARTLDSVPENATHMALDEVDNHFIVFDRRGTELGRMSADPARLKRGIVMDARATSKSCSPLSVEDAKKLPGWQKLVDTATKNWAKPSDKELKTNPDEYPDRPATVCVNQDKVTLTKVDDDGRACQTEKGNTTASANGSNGTASVDIDMGSNFDTSTTVTQESSLTVGETFTLGMSLEGLLDVSSSTTVETSLKNSIADTHSSGKHLQVKNHYETDVKNGKHCVMVYQAKTCTVNGKGRVPFEAKGWMWFNYEDKHDGHYKWCLNIEAILTKFDDRSSYLEYETVVDSETKAEAAWNCTGGSGPDYVSTVSSGRTETKGGAPKSTGAKSAASGKPTGSSSSSSARQKSAKSTSSADAARKSSSSGSKSSASKSGGGGGGSAKTATTGKADESSSQAKSTSSAAAAHKSSGGSSKSSASKTQQASKSTASAGGKSSKSSQSSASRTAKSVGSGEASHKTASDAIPSKTTGPS